MKMMMISNFVIMRGFFQILILNYIRFVWDSTANTALHHESRLFRRVPFYGRKQ